MSHTTLQILLMSQLRRGADRTAIVTAQGRTWTYGDLEAGMHRYAGALASLGLKAGERVVVQTDKSVETLLIYLAAHYLGAIYIPLNTDYTKAEVGYFLADAEPVVAVCRPSSLDAFNELAQGGAGPTCITLASDGTGTLAAMAAQNLSIPAPAPVAPDDLAAICYTSGTTGRSKGAMLSQGNLASNALALVDAWQFSARDVLIHALPIFHIHGLFVAMHCALLSGAKTLFLTKFDANEICRLMPEASVLMGVPTFYTRLLDCSAFTRDVARGMRLFVAGSAPLSADTFRSFEAHTGHRVLERYGMTETGILTSNAYEGARVPGSVGKPLPGVTLRVTDPQTGAPVPSGEVGDVEVKGDSVFKGYWRNPEKTAAEFRADGFFITGDMGRFDETGYLHLVGRAKDLIISGGLNVYPKEIEAALEDIPAVADAAVIGVPHADLGEAVVAVIKLSDPSVQADTLRQTLRTQLAGFKVPKHIAVLDELPRNAMGKVQKTVLRERFRHLFATSSSSD